MSQNDFTISETMQPQEASPVKHHMSVLGIAIAKRIFPVVGSHHSHRPSHVPHHLLSQRRGLVERLDAVRGGPKGFKRSGMTGVQATKTFAKVKALIHEALAKVEGVVKGALQIIARLTYRQRYEQSTGRNPLICPHCRSETGVWRIWHPTYGVIDDEGERIKRGTYASNTQRAGP